MPTPRFKTLAFDSAGELARLFFSFDMKKSAKDMEKIRAMQNYPGTTERLNMFVRRMKDFRDAGIEVVFTAHEDIQKIYAKGGAMAAKGQPPSDPVAIKGWPDLPGNRTPDEFCRAADNVLHVRYVGSEARWIGIRERMGSGTEYWEVKDRFNAGAIQGGILPGNYTELAKLASTTGGCNWHPPYIWMLYGSFGIGKTRSLLSFPQPLKCFDLDGGTGVWNENEREGIEIEKFNVEESNDYQRFITSTEACLK